MLTRAPDWTASSRPTCTPWDSTQRQTPATTVTSSQPAAACPDYSTSPRPVEPHPKYCAELLFFIVRRQHERPGHVARAWASICAISLNLPCKFEPLHFPLNHPTIQIVPQDCRQIRYATREGCAFASDEPTEPRLDPWTRPATVVHNRVTA